MGKILLLVLLAFVVYALWRGSKRIGDRPRGADAPREARAESDRPAEPERMVRCERCKVHLPQGEAVVADGRFFCSDEHARLSGSS